MHKCELYYQIASSRMEEQEQRRRSFDTRTSGISAVAVALTGVAMLALRDFDPDLSIVSFVIMALVVLIAVSLLAVLTYGVRVLSPSDWSRAPKLNQDVVDGHTSQGYSTCTLVMWAAKEYWTNVGENEPRIERRANYLKRQASCTIALLVLVLVVAAVALLSGA